MSETPSFAIAAIAAPHPAAAAAARDILIEGGNAIEAAVTACAVVSVVLPQVGGAGGDGVWLVREAGARGRTRVLDARGPVCAAATLRHFRERDLDAIPQAGPDAVLTVPGVVAGWRAALDLSRALGGRLPVRRLIEPAVALGREGFAAPDPALWPVPSGLEAQPGFAGAFLVDGTLPAVGVPRSAFAWAEALGYLAQAGLDDGYGGDVGREIARDLQAIGSLVTRDDLRHFEPRWREPLSLRSGSGLAEAPPTRVSLKVLASLGMFERLGSSRPDGAAHLHARIEAIKRADAMLREAEDEGPKDVDLLDAARLLAESETIDAHRAARGAFHHHAGENGMVLSVIDGQGLAVSLAGSMGTTFGSGCVLPRTGMLMGNRGAHFDLDDDNGRVLRRGRRAPMDALPLIVAGARGGVTCLGASAWPLLSDVAIRLASGQSLVEAVEAPRAGPTPVAGSEESIVSMEEGIDPSVSAALERAGHEVHAIGPALAGEAGGVRRLPHGRIEAVAEPRRGGGVAGF